MTQPPPPVSCKSTVMYMGGLTAVERGVLSAIETKGLASIFVSLGPREEKYCSISWRCPVILSSEAVGVGVVETLLLDPISPESGSLPS